MGLHIPGLAHRGIAVVRLRGVLSEVSTGRLTAVLLKDLRHRPAVGDHRPGRAEEAGMTAGRRTWPISPRIWRTAADRWSSAAWVPTCGAPSRA